MFTAIQYQLVLLSFSLTGKQVKAGRSLLKLSVTHNGSIWSRVKNKKTMRVNISVAFYNRKLCSWITNL